MSLFNTPFSALIIGSNGGIGSAITKQVKAMDHCMQVEEVNRIIFPKFDITQEVSIASIAQSFESRNQKFDLIFDATGGLEINGAKPEKGFKMLNQQAMEDQYALNALGPALLMKYFLPLLERKKSTCFATLSARVGSISDNQLGGWMSYRAAKAALNQFVKCASIEEKRKNSESCVIALHPGTVATRLSETYGINAPKIFTPIEAADKLLNVIKHIKPIQSGGFFAYDGSIIEY